jgi:putative membrane-bound dehydrogenase-like protein
MIVRADGSDNGFFVHSRHLWWQNEETAALTDLVDRRSFAQVLGNQEPGPKPPAAALRSLQARPGFAVDLVAAEPLTRDPVAFAWGPDGKFWIVEMADYPLGIDGRGKHGGRVRFLEDTNGDGQYDRSTIFLDGIGYPTGVLPWKKGVLVTTAPDIFYAEDTDGDGRADKREVLYSGFAEGNQQHRVNGLVWGLDNWIYCANGDSGGSILSVKTGEKLDIRGRDVRIRPSDGGLDAQSGQTQFGRNRDDWGNWFGCNNSNPMYQFVLADHYLRRNPHVPAPDARVPISVNPGASPVFPLSRTLARFNDFDKANRFTSACSTIIYRDDLFGPQFAGNCFTSEPVHNLVHREVMTPQGLTFTSQRSADEQQSEFLASTDNWFRPTMIQTGPDGALWVADMYRHVIEHPQWIPPAWQKRLDLRAGHDKGRIYRVAPVGAPRRPIPRLDKLPAAELVAALESPSGWQRDTVQQLLVERQAKAAAPALQKLAAESPQPLARLHALCTLDGLDALTPPVLLQGLADEHPGVRRHAVRLCEALTERPPELVEALVKLMNDPDAQVRLQLAYTLGEIDAPQAANALGQLALQESRDKFLFAAAMSSLNAKNIDQVLRAVLAQRQRGAPNLNFIEHLLNLATAFGNEQAMVGLLTEISTPKEGKLAEWQFAALASLLDTLDNRNQSLTKLRDAGDAELKATLGQVERLFVAARKTARDPQSADAERMAAVQLLGRGLDQREADISTLAALLTPQISVELQTAAAAALGRLREERVAGILLAGWKGYGPNLRGQVLDLLLSRERWQPLVLTAMEEQRVLPVDFDAARRQRLLEHKSSEIRSRAAKLLAGTVSADRQKILGEYRITLTLTGDPARGGQLFAKACAQCHKLAGTGHEVGPDLAALTDKSPESILVAVLDPNRAVESKFLNYTAVTKAGLTYQGLLAAETGNSITLKAPEAKLQVILRTDLEELLSSAKSTMPEGLEKDLKPQDLADIISHVRANVPLPKRKEFAENSPAVVQPAADGSLNLTANTCEIYGTSIVREEKYGNLGWWSSEDDHVVWQVEVLRPGKYAVWCNWACDDNSAGNRWKLEAGENALIGAVAGTGNWETYKQAQVGELTLEPGLRRLVVRSIGKPRGAALWDLKSIKLVPTK